MKNKYFLYLSLPFHLLAVLSAITFVATFQWYYILCLLFGYFVFGCIGTELGQHRYFSHRAFKLNSVLHKIVAYITVLSGQGSPIWWSALHRGYHHPLSDTVDDLHSPVNGNLNAYYTWIFSPKIKTIRLSYARDLIKDRFVFTISKHYYKVFWGSLAVLFLVFGWSIFSALLVLPILMAIHQENVINLFCHLDWVGYRNFDTDDHSRNSYVLGWLIWGQGFHNNHHQHPERYDFGVGKYEVDIHRWLVPLLIKFDNFLCTDK